MAGAGLSDSPLTFFWEYDREKAHHLQSQNTNILNRVKANAFLTKKKHQKKQGGQHVARRQEQNQDTESNFGYLEKQISLYSSRAY